MTYFVFLTPILVGLLLWAERRADPRGRVVFKLMASTSFVACAFMAGAGASAYGRWILLALAFSWLGDALLLSRRQSLFLGGLVAFLLAHLAYAGGFVTLGVRWSSVAVAGGVLGVVAIAVARWLLPKVGERMRPPVVAYLVVIAVMVALGAGTLTQRAPVLLAAPLMFFVSDLAVARDRFVKRGFENRLAGLPLYYAAQLLFAISPRLLT